MKLEEESEKVIGSLKKYLQKINTKYKDINEQETISLFTIFLEKTGFVSIENVKEYETKENYKRDQNNFYVAKFIIEQFEQETVISKYIEKIISGFMLANAIYMQVETDNKETLKKVNIYLDSPLLLNILNFKTDSQNESGNLLMKLLNEKKANVYCFKHNYDEVCSILENYRNNIKKIREKTLERLDLDEYTTSDVDRIIQQLEIMLNNKGIKVVDTPQYEKNENGEYKGVVDEKKLTDFLMENYAENKETMEGIVDRDVKSIAAIGRIRKDNKYKKIEDCKAIFVTTNYNLVEFAEKCLEHKKYEEIGYIITDVELITILWLKSFKSNPDLPKLKLIENARTALELTYTMMKRVKDVIEKMEKEGTINQADVVSSNIQELNYYKREIMEKIDGDEENINEETILGVIDKENISLRNELLIEKEKNKIIKRENEKVKEENEELKKTIKESCKNRAHLIGSCLKKVYTVLSCVLLLAILAGCIYVILANDLSASEITLVIVLGILIETMGIIESFIPKYSKLKKWFFKVIEEKEESLYWILLERKKKEFPKLFK